MGFGGVALKSVLMGLRVIQFLASIVILVIFSYFLVYLHNNDLPILTWVRAVEGLAGASALYTLIAFFLVCCLGGKTFFAFLGIALDICFFACFIAVIILTKDGNQNCSALASNSNGLYSDNQLYGDSDMNVSVDPNDAKRICDLYKVTFAIAIIVMVLYLISAIFSFFLGKHHQREKRNSATLEKQPHVGGGRPWNRFGRKSRARQMENGAVPVTNY